MADSISIAAPVAPIRGAPSRPPLPPHARPGARSLGPMGMIERIAAEFEEAFRGGVSPIAPPLTRALRELAYTYLPAQGLGGELHFDQHLPDLDVPEGPIRAILEHLVESALRDNPSVRPFCHVSVVHDEPDKVVLAVRDNGTPLPECGMDELRDYLRHADPVHVPDRLQRLFLAENLIQWLGGTLSIGPTPGADGTTILVQIPRTTGTTPRSNLVGRHVF